MTSAAVSAEAIFFSNLSFYRSSATSRARLSGFLVGAKRARTVPALSTKNFVKFHFMLLPSNPPFCCLSQT